MSADGQSGHAVPEPYLLLTAHPDSFSPPLSGTVLYKCQAWHPLEGGSLTCKEAWPSRAELNKCMWHTAAMRDSRDRQSGKILPEVCCSSSLLTLRWQCAASGRRTASRRSYHTACCSPPGSRGCRCALQQPIAEEMLNM